MADVCNNQNVHYKIISIKQKKKDNQLYELNIVHKILYKTREQSIRNII